MGEDVIIIGAGIAGMTTALRLQSRGLATLVLEAHGQVGGCAGFFSKRGFALDVGATTLVDFEPGGVGGQFLEEVGLELTGEHLPGYRAWLPDREVNLYRDIAAWKRERLSAFGDTPHHRKFWSLLDRLAETFWAASRKGIKLPFCSPLDFFHASKLISPAHWPMSRYLNWTMAEALRACGVEKDTALCGLLAMLRPFLCVALYAVFAALGWWPLAVLAVMLLFITIVAAAHDLVHQALGLPPALNHILLSAIGLLVLESGHAYQASHLQHHRHFPQDDDPEGDPARMSFWRAVLEGPVFLFRLWFWAWRAAPGQRGWLLFEASWFVGFIPLSLAVLPFTPALLVYTVLVIGGSWVYPVSTVHLPHNARGQNALFQTYTLRGQIIPKLFLELTFHLEHHLYPAVPSHHYAELARRLEPYLEREGVKPVQVW